MNDHPSESSVPSSSMRFRMIIGLVSLVGLLGLGALAGGVFTPLLIDELPDPDRPFSGARIELSHSEKRVGSHERSIPKDWPQLFGPHHNSTTTVDEKIGWEGEQPPVLWRKTIGTGYSSPIIADRLVIVPYRKEDQEIVGAYDLDSGEILWEWSTPTDYVCPNPPHSSGPYSTPLAHAGIVYIQTAAGRLVAMEQDSGNEIWSRELSQEYEVPENVFAVGHTPALDDDQLILNLGGKPEAGMLAVDRLTGETRWTSTPYGASYATPMLATMHEQEFCFVLTAEGALSLDPQTGNVDWFFPLKAISEDFVNATSPAIYQDLVIFTAYQAGTYVFRIKPDRSTKNCVTISESSSASLNPLTCRDGYLYGWHFFDKSFRCVDLATGNLQWKWTSGLGRGTHILFPDRALLYGESGKIALVSTDPQELKVLHEETPPLVKEPAFSAPPYADGKIILRNEEEMICVDVGLGE